MINLPKNPPHGKRFDFLAQLDTVRDRGHGKWSARCPAHADKTPSLSITEGERGLLLKCWSGCTIIEITSALGLRVSDLFYDAPVSRGQRQAAKPVKPDLRRLAFQYELAALDRRLRARKILDLAEQIDPSSLTDEETEAALEAVKRGYVDLERAERLEAMADDLRMKEIFLRLEGGTHTAA